MKKSALIVLLLFLIAGFAACVPTGPYVPPTAPQQQPDQVGTVPAAQPVELKVGYGYVSGPFEVFFTDPTDEFSSQLSGGVDGPLVAALDNARQSVDVAVYSLSLNSVRNALIDAHRRGVVVRVVMESDNMDRSDPQKLISAGIPVVGDRREGLMHNKFVVIDRSEVWTGSMNFTDGGAYNDNNNLVRLRSTQLAENYTREFEEMFLNDTFGPDQGAETPNPKVRLDGVQVENYFSPDDGVSAEIVDLINRADESVYFLAYSFTSDEIAQALIAKKLYGLSVKGVMEEEQVNSNEGTEYDPFLQAGVDVRLDGNEGLMHHKVFIIDEETVILGSYNFSASAENRNDENVIIIHDAKIAYLYLDEFWRVFNLAQQP